MTRRIWKTLRFRLALWNALVVVLTAVLVLLGLRHGVRWAILHEMDQILVEDIEEIRLALRELPADKLTVLIDELERKSRGHKHHGWFVRLVNKDDQIVWTSLAAGADAPPVVAFRSDQPTTIGSSRLVQRAVDETSNGITSVQTGATLSFLDEDMARIDRLVLIVAGAVLFAASLVAYWLAGRASRAIGDIIQTAGRLRPNRLNERLPIRGTGDELDQLALTVNGLLDRIADYLAKKRDFLADAAHELRSPLAAIRSSVDVALASNCTEDDYKNLLIEIIDQGESLETLVNQLLLISESEAERLKFDRELVELDDVVRRALDMFAGVAESKELTLDRNVSENVRVRGNRHLLRQLVNNLVDNAVKYTPPRGRVRVELTAEPAAGVAKLAVSDTGVGIAATDLPRIFDRFFRADRSRTRISEPVGTGLGLSICKAVVEAHHGRIECESQPDQGTRVTVTLPL